MSKYKKYPQYKDSGVEWLGNVPSNWNTKRLKNIIRAGITDGPHETPVFLDDGIPFLSVDGIQNGELTFIKSRYISYIAHKQYSQKANIEKDDILLGKAASIGKVARVKVDFEFSIWSPLALIKPKLSVVTPSYLEYLLKSSLTQYQIQQLSTSNTQQNISMADIPKFIFSMPDIEEQQTIANYLDKATAKIDTLIEKQTKLIELLKEKRQAVISTAVTRGLDSSVLMKDSGVAWLGKIPEHWTRTPLRYIGRLQNGISKGGDYFGSGFPFVNYGDIYKNGTLPLHVKGLAKSNKEDQHIYSVRIGDVFFTRTSETIDDIGMASTCVETIDNATFSGFTIRFRQLKRVLNEHFSKYYFRTGHSQSFFEKQLNLVTRASLGQDILKQLPVLLLPMEEQETIANYLDDKTSKIDILISKSTKAINLLREKRTALISAVVTGKIDVREVSLYA